MRYKLTRLKWQLVICLIFSGAVAVCLWWPAETGADIATLDRSTFITWLSAVASILALFCSISIAFVLFVTQSNRAERVTSYDVLKTRLLEAQQWLLTQPVTKDREICLSLVFALDKLDLSDLPQTDRGAEYEQYAVALEEGIESELNERREFFLTSSIHFLYIEHLLNRIGLVSIRQIITKAFIDTLAKGVAVIGLAVVTLIVAAIWYNETVKPVLVFISTFCGVASMFLFYEFCLDIYRNDNEELDFIDRGSDDEG